MNGILPTREEKRIMRSEPLAGLRAVDRLRKVGRYDGGALTLRNVGRILSSGKAYTWKIRRISGEHQFEVAP